LELLDRKLRFDGYEKDYLYNLGLSEQMIEELKKSIDTNLVPMIRKGEQFDLDRVLMFFNEMFNGEV